MTPSSEPSEVAATDWLAVCRRALAGVRAALEPYPRTADRATTTGRGEGGDLALVIDRAAEDAVFAELGATGVGMTVVSEERGRVELGGGGPLHVVVDPIDGSLNAKRRLPLHCVSIAVADGPSMDDVVFGYVAGLEHGTEWWSTRGEGAFQDGERLAVADGGFEVLGIESAHPRAVANAAEALAETGADRLRAIGAIAISLCFVAAGRMDAMISLRTCRSVDAAAGQLIVREAGGAVLFPEAGDGDLGRVGLGLEMRSRVLAAADAGSLQRLARTVSAPA